MESWKETLRKAEQCCKERTLVELLGRRRVLVEHHRGIRGYSREEILVGTDDGQLRVEGQNLCLCCMSREQVLITGTIAALICEGSDG